jgi:DNA-binding CsgD family transcriptional regulator
VNVAAAERRIDALARRCYVGLDAASLRDETLRGLRAIVPIDAAFFAVVDPATMLFTAILAEEPLGEAGALFLENEFGQADVNKFTALAFATDHVKSLDAATSADRPTSARYVDVMAPLGLGDELRAALVSAGRCWGVLCLHRSDRPTGFGVAEIALVRRLVPHLAEGLRRAIVASAAVAPQPTLRGPGVIVLDENLSITSTNAEAEQWMADLYDARWMDAGTGALPAAVYAAAAQAAQSDESKNETAAVTRLRTRNGAWLAVHVSRLGGPTGRQTAVVVESARPMQMASLYLDAQGLTPAQKRVTSLVLQGRSTKEIVKELRISAYTVQEHLSSVFDKFGVGSRRELVAALLGPST